MNAGRESQTTADVLMIRPATFCANSQTVESNHFQNPSARIVDAQSQAVEEFDGLVRKLRAAGVRVQVFEDTLEPATPDALFPNNWVSFHSDGTAVLYPMLAENRRQERRMEILESLDVHANFRIDRMIDLTHREKENHFLEGTGSLVLDRIHHVAYACGSPRTHIDALGEFSQRLDYDVIAFEAADRNEHPIYHTNVMLSIGSHFAAVCSAAIREDQRDHVVRALRSTGRAIVDISFEQMHEFAGNMLELSTATGRNILALSERAHSSLTQNQREELRRCAGELLVAPIPTIETLGGGSVRCMIAEIHLPRR